MILPEYIIFIYLLVSWSNLAPFLFLGGTSGGISANTQTSDKCIWNKITLFSSQHIEMMRNTYRNETESLQVDVPSHIQNFQTECK